MNKIKLLRLTTIPASLDSLLAGQLKFLNQHFKVVGVSGNGKRLDQVKEREGIEVRAVDMEREISIFKDLVSLIKLTALFIKEKPAIVHSNTPKSSLLSMTAAAIARTPVRIYTVTGLRFEGFPPSFGRSLLEWMERITCKMATHVIPEGKGVKQTLIANKITRKELRVVANGNISGIDVDHFSRAHFSEARLLQLKKELGIHDHDFVFCFIGRLVIDKGITELVAAFESLALQHSNMKLLLVGPFEESGNALPDSVRTAIKTNPAIISTGLVEDVRPYLAVSDLFVFPSYREGFPNVVMQAGAMELPCVVTDINGSNEIITEQVNGIIVKPKDSAALEAAMLSLYTDREKQARFKANARKMITDRYEQRIVWQAMLERYNEYLATKNILTPNNV